jgi:antitoxin component YwqK of YwqJK toxin-antitoxin module
MKTSLFFLMMISVLSQGQVLNSQDGLYYKESKLFTGRHSVISEDRKVADLSIVEGKLQGEAVYYSASGDVLESGNFVDSKRDGKWLRYDDNGKISAEAWFMNGLKHGRWIVWNKTGQKVCEMVYNKGEKTGIWTTWDDNGKIASQRNFDPL